MKKLLLIVLFVPLLAKAQNITTIAGNRGLAGTITGDGGPATACTLNSPFGVASDTHGNIYIADQNTGRIRKIDSAGIIHTVAGDAMGALMDSGLATAVGLPGPEGVAIDNAGNIYIAARSNDCVYKVNDTGYIEVAAGIFSGYGSYVGYSGDNIPASTSRLYSPFGVAADNFGNFYIADEGNQRIRKVNAAGIITTIAGNGIPGYS